MRSRSSFIILFCFFLGWNPAARAQDAIDTLIQKVNEEAGSDYEEDYEADTTLTFSNFGTSDSIPSFRRAKEFAWSKTLDSLLRIVKGLKGDTISIEQSASSSKSKEKKQKSNNDETITLAKDDGPSVLANPAIRLILWILAGVFILFIIYRLFLSQGMFMREKKYSGAGTNAEDENDLPQHLSDFDRNIQAALKAGNYRLAVRYLYLQALNKLSTAGHINYSADKTNYQYVREVYSKPYRNEFAALTLNYEYVWYGNFEIDENICRRLQDDFNQFYRKI